MLYGCSKLIHHTNYSEYDFITNRFEIQLYLHKYNYSKTCINSYISVCGNHIENCEKNKEPNIVSITIITLLLIIVIAYRFYSDRLDFIKVQTKNNLSEITVIGIAGKKHSGKNTMADVLIKNHGFTELAFAYSLKNACKEIFGFTNDQMYDQNLKEEVDNYWCYSPRQIMQTVGTELFRDMIKKTMPEIGDSIWIRSLERKIIEHVKQNKNKFVITDVRFENEHEFIKSSKFKTFTIKLVREQRENNRIDHKSESHIDLLECDAVLVNGGTIDDLHREGLSILIENKII